MTASKRASQQVLPEIMKQSRASRGEYEIGTRPLQFVWRVECFLGKESKAELPARRRSNAGSSELGARNFLWGATGSRLAGVILGRAFWHARGKIGFAESEWQPAAKFVESSWKYRGCRA